VFWDTVHPTTRADALIASAFASAVPEPEMISMFIAGLIVLGFAGGTGRMWRKRRYAQVGVGSPHGMSLS
jgi:phospholipase/lecithinase/hemolysin